MTRSKLTILGNRVNYSSTYDPDQIEVFPRAPRRTNYKAPMLGYDVWRCYELSFLDKRGLPYFKVIEIITPATSKNIFESKSLKLYLNSFNNTQFENLEEVLDIIKKDLSERVGAEVIVREVKKASFIEISSPPVEEILKTDFLIKEYSYNPLLLKIEEKEEKRVYKLYSSLLRSNCEITSQPDWAYVFVQYEGKRKLDEESFLKYIISYRNHNEFHEPTTERIFNDLYEILSPELLLVTCMYTRRGGIDINPIRFTPNYEVDIFTNKLLFRTINQ